MDGRPSGQPDLPAESILSLEAWKKLMDDMNEGMASHEQSPDAFPDDASEGDSLSESEQGSDLDDVAQVKALPASFRTWQTNEDRELGRVRALASHLREQPHLPYAPDDPAFQTPWRDPSLMDMYVELPYFIFCNRFVYQSLPWRTANSRVVILFP